MPSPSIMTGRALPRTLQSALSDVVGASGPCVFEYREGEQPPEAIGIVTSSGTRNSSPLFASDGIGPDLHALPFREVHFWVRAVCVYSKAPVIRRVKTDELFAIWDYEGKLESRQWSHSEQLAILRGRVACPPAKMLRRFTQYICNACLTRLSSGSQTLGSDFFGAESADDLPFAKDDSFVHALVDGNAFVEKKMNAMKAHSTQIAVDGPFFALSNNVGLQVWGNEYYTLVKGEKSAPLNEKGYESDLFAGISL